MKMYLLQRWRTNFIPIPTAGLSSKADQQTEQKAVTAYFIMGRVRTAEAVYLWKMKRNHTQAFDHRQSSRIRAWSFMHRSGVLGNKNDCDEWRSIEYNLWGNGQAAYTFWTDAALPWIWAGCTKLYPAYSRHVMHHCEDGGYNYAMSILKSSRAVGFLSALHICLWKSGGEGHFNPYFMHDANPL